MTTPHADALKGLRPFQRATVKHAEASLFGDQGTGRFLVADEVGLGKTRVAAALIRTLDTPRRRTVVVYFAPNAEVARQNLRVLRTRVPDREPPARLTLLSTALDELRRPGIHVLGMTPGTSLTESKRTGRVDERALLLALLRPAWRCGEGTAVCQVMRDRAGLTRFRSELGCVPAIATRGPIARSFHRKLKGRPDLKERFLLLKRRSGRGVPKRLRQERRDLICELLGLLARASLDGLDPRLIIFDEFQKYTDVLKNAGNPTTIEHELIQKRPTLLLSATPYKMKAGEQTADSQVDLNRLLRFLYDDEKEASIVEHQLSELRRSFRALRPDDDVAHAQTVIRVKVAKEQVEQSLHPVMSRWQRPQDNAVTNHDVLPLSEDDIEAYLAFQRVVDISAATTGLRHRATVEYWKSAPHLLAFMRAYRVKESIDEAWADPNRRKEMLRALKASRAAFLSLRDINRYRPLPVANARYRDLAERTLADDQWRALWVPPALAPYAPEGHFAKAAAAGATKTLVFSGWRVVPTSVAGLLGYEAERRSAVGQQNTKHARTRRNARQLLSLRHDAAKGLQRATILALVYPSLELASSIDPYELARTEGALPSRGAVLERAKRMTRKLAGTLTKREASNRPDPRWYWAAPMLLDQERGVDVHGLLTGRDGLRRAWQPRREDAPQSEALLAALKLCRDVLAGRESLGRQPQDLAHVLAQVAVGGPATTALRTLMRKSEDPDLQVSAGRIGWGMRTLLNRADATLVVQTSRRKARAGDAGAYWRDALDYCVDGALQGVMDEYLELLLDEHGRPDLPTAKLARKVAVAFQDTTDLQPLAVTAQAPRGDHPQFSDRRLTSRFAAAFGSTQTEEEAGVHPEIVRQAFNSPFWPWVLVTTSIGQEGLDFHRYCHQLVHWNVPASPVELEQREGRVMRFLGHAVRKNIAQHHGREGRAAADPWTTMLEAARVAVSDAEGFAPEWVYEGDATVRRFAPLPPFSRDQQRLDRVQAARVFYRLVLGQPNPQELVDVVMANIPVDLARRLIEQNLALDLRPRTSVNLSPS